MATLAEDVDAYFGEDTYDWAADLARRTRLARNTYDTFVRRFFGIYDDGLYLRLDLLEQIAADVDLAFRKLRARQKVDRRQFKTVIELFETASDCVELEIEQLQGMFGHGLASAMTPFVRMFPFRELARELKAYEQALSRLDGALAQANRELTEAKVDKAIDIFQGIVTFALPEIALAKEIVLGAAGLFADSRLGPQDPDASKIARTTASTLKEPLLKVTKLTKSMTNVAGIASKMNAVYDVFSADELDAAHAAIRTVKAAIDHEKAVHKRIMDDIWSKWRIRIAGFQASLERANRQLEESAARLNEVRDALRDQREIARYRSPTPWRLGP